MSNEEFRTMHVAVDEFLSLLDVYIARPDLSQEGTEARAQLRAQVRQAYIDSVATITKTFILDAFENQSRTNNDQGTPGV